MIFLLVATLVLPAPAGPHAVGRTTLHRADAARDGRAVVLHVWYPAVKTNRAPATYIDLVDDEVFRKSYSFVGFDRLRDVRPHAVADAKPARGRHPVVVFSHGLGMVSAMYTTLLENLASHGYVVVRVDSPGFSSAMRLADGRIVKNESKRPWFTGEPTPEQQAELIRIRESEAIVQAEDLRFALTELTKMRSRFRADVERVGVFGHSRGGFAAPHACHVDARFDACLNLDGYRLTTAVMQRGIRQPYMHIEEVDDEVTAEERREQEETFGRMRTVHVRVAGAKHHSFSDVPLIAPEKYPAITIDARRALEITNAYVVAFFDEHLRGRKTAVPEYPEVRVKRY